MFFSKTSFLNKGQSLIGIVIVFVVVGLLIGGLSFYFSKRTGGNSELPEAPEIEAPEPEVPETEISPEIETPEDGEEPANNDQPEEEPAEECFIGGCSGELCTDNPEVISTCELLPGMECFGEEMNCQLVEGECSWVLSQEAARCLLDVRARLGKQVTESRIGYLFNQAEELLIQ